MQQRGLVERSNCSEDRRGAFIVLTERGRAAVERAAPRHVESVRQYLFDGLTDEQVGTLQTIADAVIDRLDAVDCPDEDGCTDGVGAGSTPGVETCS
jgi:DNA-binding MarR family transcriptional regulator